MDHDLEIIIARLEILEIEVCNILQNPGNIGKMIFLQSYPGNIGKWIFWIFSYPGNIGKRIFLISHILEILDRTIHTQFYPGNSGSYDPYILTILKIWHSGEVLYMAPCDRLGHGR